MRKIITTYKRLLHQLTARHSYGFGVHSPFLFGLTKFIVYNKNPFYIFEKIESLVQMIVKKSSSQGAKPRQLETKRYQFDLDSSRKRERQVLFRIVNELRPHSILELGAELGISTAYLASGNPKSFCRTLIAADASSSEIKENLKFLGIENVQLVDSNLLDAIDEISLETAKIDFVFINPSVSVDSIRFCYEQTLPLIHNDTVFILSEIHRSKERENLWRDLCSDKNTTAHFDLFSLGFLFFRQDLAKKKYKMRF